MTVSAATHTPRQIEAKEYCMVATHVILGSGMHLISDGVSSQVENNMLIILGYKLENLCEAGNEFP